MAYKQFSVGDNLVTIYKHKAARSLKLSIASNGQVRVSIPSWAPYKAGIDFAKSRQSWIEAHLPQAEIISPNQAIGKAHHIQFEANSSDKITTRIKQTEIIISHPLEMEYSDPRVQDKAKMASIKALKKQAEALLPQRLEGLANRDDFKYKSVSVKQLRSRWGSCDQDKNIILNLYLMQLPWSLIDYVLLHELAHTKVLKHGPQFWAEMETHLSGSKDLRKELRSYKTTISNMT
jgi:predicted metal-dependent hydrolase